MKIRMFLFSFMMILSSLVFAQEQTTEQRTVPISQNSIQVQPQNENVPLEEVVNEVIKTLTDSDAQIKLPAPFNPSDTESVFEWWMFIYGLVMPIGLWLIFKFFPATTKPELILKSTSIGIVVLLIIVMSKGASVLVIGQAVVAFLLKTFSYDKLYNPLGLKSTRLYQE